MADEYAIYHHSGGKLRIGGADAAIAALAGRQHGVVARRQLLALGVTGRSVERRIEGGRLHRVHPGVYAVGHSVLTQHGHWMAAVLAGGPGAVLSHRSAAALWRIRPTSSPRIEITVPKQLRPRPRLLPHCAVLPPDEKTTLHGIPTTTAARTQLDLAAVVPRHQLDRALNEAEVLRLQGPQELLARYAGKRGTRTLRTLLSMSRSTPTRSELEADFKAFLDARPKIPRPENNTIIEGYEADFVWRDAKLIVELDGYATHGTRRSFERDRARDRRLLAKGWRTARLTSRSLAAPATLADELLSSITA